MLTVVADPEVTPAAAAVAASSVSPIDEIVREGAQRMLAAALEAEVAAYYAAKFGKAVAKITDDLDELLRFYDYPALRHEAPVRREALGTEGGGRPPRWAVAAAWWELSAA